MSDVPAIFDLFGAPLQRDVCTVTALSPITITWNGQAGIAAEKIAGSTVVVGTAYVLYAKGIANKPLVYQTATS
jgi:hypothetical protein